MSVIASIKRRSHRLWMGARGHLEGLGRRLYQRWFVPIDGSALSELRLEQRFIAARYCGIVGLALALPMLGLPPGRLVAAFGLLGIAGLYNAWIHHLLDQRSRWLNDGYLTSTGDGLLTIAMMLIGGGFDSSFYFILFTTTMAVAMRFGYGPSILVLGLYILLDLLTTTFGSESRRISADFLFRSSFLSITSLLACYLREQASAAEAALGRQLALARMLNESTHTLNTSLEIDTVLQIVAAEAKRMGMAEDTVLKLGVEHGSLAVYDLAAGAEASEAASRDHRQQLDHLVPHGEIQEGPLGAERVLQGRARGDRPFVILPLYSRTGLTGRIALLRGPGAPAFDGAEIGLLNSFLDRATLAIVNASFYKTIGDRSRDLQRAYGDLAAAHQELLSVDEMKTNFIANVSHELRTPLTSVRSFSELLLSYDVDAQTRQEFLGIINMESERLTRLVNDVLDVTKIEAGKIDWKMDSHDLNELLRSGARSLIPLIAEKELRFNLIPAPTGTQVWVDPDRIVQVLANLLGNALKFTEQGEITLAAAVEDPMAVVHVRDTGIGIDPAHQERLFEKFHQVGETLTAKPMGTGLGLAITREIVAHHGGKIWLDSAPGEGSCFSFSLLLARAAEGGKFPSPQVDHTGRARSTPDNAGWRATP